MRRWWAHAWRIRVVHGSDGPAGRVGSSRVTILPDFGGSGQHFGFFSFLLIMSWYPNRYEFSNTIHSDWLIFFYIYYTIIEWFRSIHWIIFCEKLQYQPSGRRPRGWYCKFEQNIIQCILKNHSIIVLSHRLLKKRCMEREGKEDRVMKRSGDSGFELLWLGEKPITRS